VKNPASKATLGSDEGGVELIDMAAPTTEAD
jgi:hypothetical protein